MSGSDTYNKPEMPGGQKLTISSVIGATAKIVVPSVLAPLLLFLPLGWYLDMRLESRPWAMVGALILSFAGTNWLVFRRVKKISAKFAASAQKKTSNLRPGASSQEKL